MTGERNNPMREEQGFTLIELLVGLAILAAVLAVIAPLAGRTRAGMELRNTAFDIASSMRNARSAARLSNAEQTLLIDVGSRLLWTEGQTVRKPLPRHFGMSLEFPVTEQVSANAGRMRFFPDGSASGGKIVLRESSRTATVFVNWLNGDVEVQWTR
ncbi:MAG TPA: GspH/FimT family pseudopilin [Hyphomicrobiaceae bacterium]|jgi:general secretion pathway protein H|nr:GspH/FimT family pseudopilin [Hyphomicrobiaceae bacterium]